MSVGSDSQRTRPQSMSSLSAGEGRARQGSRRDSRTNIIRSPLPESSGTEHKMKRTWTIIGVRDVAANLRWYQSLFGQPQIPPAHDHFGQIVDEDGTVLLCLHRWGAHEHPTLTNPGQATSQNGLLLFFRVDDYDGALGRARELVDHLAEEPHVNPNTQTREFSLWDPDGYYVSISEG